MVNRIVATVLCCFTFSQLTIADEIKVAAGVFIGIIEEDGQGPYQLILKEAAKRADIDFTEVVYPLKRAVLTFTERRALTVYGMTEAVIEEIGEDNIITSYPLGIYKVFIFTHKGEPAISNYDQLKGKVLGGVNGYQTYYRGLIEQGIDITYFAQEEHQLMRYEKGRIDAIIGFMPDWMPYLDRLTYDPNFPIIVGYDYMTVWKTPAGRAFVDKISPVLQGMKLDGTLKEILGDRYMDFDYKATRKFEWVPDQ